MQTSLLDGARNNTPTLPPAHVSASDLRSVVSGFRGFSILASDLGVRGVAPFGRRPHPHNTPRGESLPARHCPNGIDPQVVLIHPTTKGLRSKSLARVILVLFRTTSHPGPV